MLHNLTADQIMILLRNNEGFRCTATTLLLNMVPPEYKKDELMDLKLRVKHQIPTYNTTGKIAAIKFVRAYVADNQHIVKHFTDAGYDVYVAPGYNHDNAKGPQTLCLASAKRFVESIN